MILLAFLSFLLSRLGRSNSFLQYSQGSIVLVLGLEIHIFVVFFSGGKVDVIVQGNKDQEKITKDKLKISPSEKGTVCLKIIYSMFYKKYV